MGIRVFQISTAKFSLNPIAPLGVLMIYFLDLRTASRHGNHKAALRLDLFEKLIVSHGASLRPTCKLGGHEVGLSVKLLSEAEIRQGLRQ